MLNVLVNTLIILLINLVMQLRHIMEIVRRRKQEKWNQRKPNISNFKVFGCECLAHILDKKQKKLEPKSHKCIFISYDEISKFYTLFDPSNQSVIIIRDVQFHQVSPPPKSVEHHITLNFLISPITPIFVTPSSSFLCIIDHSSSSSSSITPESNESPKVNLVASNLLVWVTQTLEFAGNEFSNPSYTCRTTSNFLL